MILCSLEGLNVKKYLIFNGNLMDRDHMEVQREAFVLMGSITKI